MKKAVSILSLMGLTGLGLTLLVVGLRELFPKVQVQERVVEVPVMLPAPVPSPVCMKFALVGYWPETGEYVTVAETELCGQGLAWQDNAYGPSLIDKIDALANEIAAWKDCAESRLLCAAWQLEEIKGGP